MAAPPPVQKKDRRPWVAVLLVLIIGVAWCSAAEDSPPESSSPPVVFVPTPEPEQAAPIARPEIPDAAIALDAGLAKLIDAGSPVLARKPPDPEDYMRRWREALESLFEHGKYPGAPTVLRAAPRKEEHEEPDAGSCEPELKRLAIRVPKIDLVVVVDTSGSMTRAIPKIAEWLGAIEKRIVDTRLDTQLLVVADQVDLDRKTADGGYHYYVNSGDAVEVLLASARASRDRWTDALRPGAVLQIVVVTDDNSDGKSAPLLAQLRDTLPGVPFTVNLLGGLDTPGHVVLDAQQPLVGGEAFCDAEGVLGLETGVVYQQLARATGGLRAPLCHAEAREALAIALLSAKGGQGFTCAWLLDKPAHRIARVDALTPNGPPTSLFHEPVPSNCYATRRSYRLEEKLLELCEDTCTALRKEGYDALEVRLECK